MVRVDMDVQNVLGVDRIGGPKDHVAAVGPQLLCHALFRHPALRDEPAALEGAAGLGSGWVNLAADTGRGMHAPFEKRLERRAAIIGLDREQLAAQPAIAAALGHQRFIKRPRLAMKSVSRTLAAGGGGVTAIKAPAGC